MVDAKKLKSAFRDLAIFAGSCLFLYGIWQIYIPAAYIIAGSIIVFGAIPAMKKDK